MAEVASMSSNKYKYYMDIAETVAKASHDAETQVGSILVNNSNNSIIATGYNGFVRKAPDHILPKTRPDKHKYMIHSETNLIYNCAKNGISMDNCTLYCTLSPCASCARALWQCGITRVVAKNQYKDLQDFKDMIDLKTTIEIDEATGFSVITYG